MKMVFILIVLILLQTLTCNNNNTYSGDYRTRKHYAVLVCGSNGYHNYADQADVAHVYKSLVATGMPRENIILFFYDDIAYNTENPFPGKLFNKPASNTLGDVYAGIRIDYRGHDVTVKNLQKVLMGDKEAMKGIGTGKVLQTTSNDYIFFYYNDHGNTGILSMPNHEVLYANELNMIFRFMYTVKMYDKMFVFVDACYSGSIFNNILKPDISLYATTSAHPWESAYMTYCQSNDLVAGVKAGKCLGAEYTVNFADYMDANGPNGISINDAYFYFFTRVKKSQVREYGDLSFNRKIYGEFFGTLNRPDSNDAIQNKTENFTRQVVNMFGSAKSLIKSLLRKDKPDLMINSYNVKAHYLFDVAKTTNDAKAWEEYKQEIKMNKFTDNTFKQFDSILNAGKVSLDTDIINFECLKPSVSEFISICKNWGEYQMQYVRNIAAACQDHTSEEIIQTFTDICESF